MENPVSRICSKGSEDKIVNGGETRANTRLTWWRGLTKEVGIHKKEQEERAIPSRQKQKGAESFLLNLEPQGRSPTE